MWDIDGASKSLEAFYPPPPARLKNLCTFLQLLWKKEWQFFKKLKIKLSYDLEVPFLDIYPKEMKEGS